MKKYLLTALLVSSFVFASAQTLPDVDDSAQIEDTSYYCPNITVSLYKGLNDRKTKGQVSELQKFLSDYFNVKVSGGVFGQATKNYVIKFQKENGLPSVGTVGKATRDKIAALCSVTDEESTSGSDITNNTQVKQEKICKGAGTRSEGWYDSKTGELINYDNCSGTTLDNKISVDAYFSPASISAGKDSATLYWNSKNTTECDLYFPNHSNLTAKFAGVSGANSVGMFEKAEDVRVTVTCKNSNGQSVEKKAVLSVGAPVSNSKSINVLSPSAGMVFEQGQPMTISWQAVGPNANYTVSYADPGPTIGTYSASQAHCEASDKCYISWTPNFSKSNIQITITDTVSRYYGTFITSVTKSESVQVPTISYIQAKVADTGTVFVGESTYISGTGLSGQITVKIGGQSVVATSNGDTAVTFFVPKLPAGYTDVTVINSAGKVSNTYRVLVIDNMNTTVQKPMKSACNGFPCYFEASAGLNSDGKYDSPPAMVSAKYPYEFTLLKQTNVKMTIHGQVWAKNPTILANTMFVKVDGNQVYSLSSVEMSKDNHVINLGILEAGLHKIEIFAKPDQEHFQINWFYLEDSNNQTMHTSVPITTTPASVQTSISAPVQTFTTAPNNPYITISSPNGNEAVIPGQVYHITWTSTSTIDKVTLGYSFGVGSLNWIANNIPNTGSYDWNVNFGNTANKQFKISIIGYQTGVGSWSDESDAPVNIASKVSDLSKQGQVLGASVSCTNISINLHRGAESSSVTNLQKFLQGKGLLNEVTGFYGDKTVEAVKDYQASKNLPLTGMVYGVTRESVRMDSCGQ